MKTAQSLNFFIRQVRPVARNLLHSPSPLRHPFSQDAPRRRLGLHSKPLRSLNPTSGSFSVPYSTTTKFETHIPPGASFSPDNHQTAAASPSSPAESAIIEQHVTNVFGAEVTSPLKPKVPTYQIHVTCKPCGHRSAHVFSKQSYHTGSVLVTCPSCKNRHIISDHLKVFSDVTLTIEGLMKAKGQLVKRGNINEEGNIELREDGSEADFEAPKAENIFVKHRTSRRLE